MALGPLNFTTGHTRVLTDLRSQMTELQRALGTGIRSETYGGLGATRSTSLALHQRHSGITAFESAIDLVSLRLSLADQTLGRLSEVAGEVRSTALASTYTLQGDGRTMQQQEAYLRLDETVALLNTQADGRYMFGGVEISDAPVQPMSAIIDGDGARDGLRTLVSQRKAADLGASGLGRVAISTTATELTLSEDGTHPFGFKITSLSTSIAGATTGGPTGSPPAATLDLGANQPVAGDTVRFVLALPDGSETAITLAATTDSPPADGEFEIGGTVAATIANLGAALDTKLAASAGGDLAAASAIAASGDVFAGTTATPPRRVDGPPFDSATAFVAGTAEDTVVWYTGATSTGNPRLAATAEVDEGLRVNYGLEANEEAFRQLMQFTAVFAIESFDTTVAADADRFSALRKRVGEGLGYPTGVQTLDQVRVEIGISQSLVGKASDRHRQELGLIANLSDEIEGVNITEVAAELLTIQTRLEASYQATSIVAQLTLANYLR